MEEQEIQLIKEIKRLEQELYIKRSKLAAPRSMRKITDLGIDAQAWEKEFSKIINLVGKRSVGG
jgi:predicted  nucleic acid-binding Zn-ribbon protein